MKAFVTGASGQDGFYLCELLLEKGYEVYGLVRRTSQGHELPSGIEVVEGDLTEAAPLIKAIATIRPDEIYNLAALSHVGISFEIPNETFRVNVGGAINCLEAAKRYGAKIYQASSSEMFGNHEGPCDETTPLNPVSPYGASKVAAHHLVRQYREQGVFACAGILFNHESIRRGGDFVTQRVVNGVARVRAGLDSKILLGNLDAQRDWGHAKDYVRAMYLMMQRSVPEDYIIATGRTRSVRDLLDVAWGPNWKSVVEVDKALFRPVELSTLRANPSRAFNDLGWRPWIPFESMIASMLSAAREKLSEQREVNFGVSRLRP